MLQELLNNTILSFIIKVILIIYIIIIIKQISHNILLLYDNQLFRIIFLLLIFYISHIDISIALLLSISYILPIYKLNKLVYNINTFNNYMIYIKKNLDTHKIIGGNVGEQLKQLNMKRLGKKYASWVYMAGRIAYTYLWNKYVIAMSTVVPTMIAFYQPILYIPSDKEDNIVVDTYVLPPGMAWVPNPDELEELTQRILAHDIPWPAVIYGDYQITQLQIARKLFKKYFHPETGKFYDIWDTTEKTETDEDKIKDATKYLNNKPKTDVSINNRGYTAK